MVPVGPRPREFYRSNSEDQFQSFPHGSLQCIANNIPVVCVSMDHLPQDTVLVRCFPFDATGIRPPSRSVA